jgi:integrase
MDEGHDQAGAEAKEGTRGLDQAHPLQLRPHGLPGGRQGAGDPAGPTAGISPPRVAKAEGKIKIPTPEQVCAALLEAPDHFHAFVAVCAFAGLRLGEAAGFQLGDVDFLR